MGRTQSASTSHQQTEEVLYGNLVDAEQIKGVYYGIVLQTDVSLGLGAGSPIPTGMMTVGIPTLGVNYVSDPLPYPGGVAPSLGSQVAVGFDARNNPIVVSVYTTNLPKVGTPGTYGSATAVPILTVDSNGRLTAVTTTPPLDATKLPLSGGTMSGAIAMGSSKITGLADGTAAQDAVAFGQLPTDSGWIAFTYINGWGSAAGPATTATAAGYRKQGNVVRLAGQINQPGSGNDYPFTLPTGYRPTANCFFPLLDQNTATVVGYLEVQTGGVVVCSISSTNQTYSLDGMTFTID